MAFIFVQKVIVLAYRQKNAFFMKFELFYLGAKNTKNDFSLSLNVRNKELY